MKLLGEIRESDVGIEPTGEILEHQFIFRKSARAILLNDKSEVSIQYIGRDNYYKLPGGGVEAGETEEEALRREIREEVGCELTIKKELGIIIEYRNNIPLLHLSYGYLAQVDGPIGTPSFEAPEIEEGCEALWMPMDEAHEKLTSHRPDPKMFYELPFIVARELLFLEEARKQMQK